MSKSIVISQPYLFPWVGLFEQLKLADIFVHYDDVQFSKGHFEDRVQIKTKDGFKWMTIPKHNLRLGQNICEVQIDYSKDWRKSHIDFLTQTYQKAPYLKDMIYLVKQVYENDFKYISELTISSINVITEYFDLYRGKEFYKSSNLHIEGNKTQKVLSTVKYFNADKYITGMGALRYFEFDLFEKHGVRVEFIKYEKKSYPQINGDFNPFVSTLDLIANTGKLGIDYVCSGSVYWKEFIRTEEAQSYLMKTK